ncbi:MAG TPA: MBL fold metallo-hydrolase [Steroidobacteraceae bacterium]|jgi:glyoxylase-like metal-dependent hydrolase (beta-lactamase superfamily II)
MAAALTYPFATEPGFGDASAVQIQPGLFWLRMPLFGALKFINVWALSDAEGWTIVDTGIQSAETIDAWRGALKGALRGAPVSRVLVTHMHPDHVGVAGWMSREFRAPLWMSRLEYLSCRMLVADSPEAPAEAIEFLKCCGWPEEQIARYREKFGFFGRMIAPLPAAYRRLSDGQIVNIGDSRWQVIVGNGHSPEHACLYCPERQVFISGDQVLPRISSNVSVYPTEPEADPLDDWLNSLARIRQRVPNEVLVLPAHNSPFAGLHQRIDELMDSHREGLSRLTTLLSAPKRVVDVFPALFNRPITPELLGMASGEALAHLNYLWHRGEVERRLVDGVWWWVAKA